MTQRYTIQRSMTGFEIFDHALQDQFGGSPVSIATCGRSVDAIRIVRGLRAVEAVFRGVEAVQGDDMVSSHGVRAVYP